MKIARVRSIWLFGFVLASSTGLAEAFAERMARDCRAPLSAPARIRPRSKRTWVGLDSKKVARVFGRLIDDGFVFSNPDYERLRFGRMGFQRLLEAGARLDDDVRLRLIAKARRAPSRDPVSAWRQHLVRVALHDGEACDQTADVLVRFAGATFFELNDLHYAHRGLTDVFEDRVLRSLGARYFELPKSPTCVLGGPKRIADRVIKRLLRGDAIIARALARGRTPVEAYDEYLRNVGRYVRSPRPVRRTQIVRALEALRRSMIDEPGFARRSPAIYVGGSFVNGRADLEMSDIDILTDDESDAPFARTATARIRAALGVDRGFAVSWHFGPGHVWSGAHPVVVRVRKEATELLVHRPLEREPFLVIALDQ